MGHWKVAIWVGLAVMALFAMAVAERESNPDAGFAIAAAPADKEATNPNGKETDKKGEDKTETGAKDKDPDADNTKTATPSLLDLKTGVTAGGRDKEVNKKEEGGILAGGVTAVQGSEEGGDKSTIDKPGHLDPQLLWTPNSERFLLNDRQQDLTFNPGTKNDAKPVPGSASPQPVMKAVPQQPARTEAQALPPVLKPAVTKKADPPPVAAPANASSRFELPEAADIAAEESAGGPTADNDADSIKMSDTSIRDYFSDAEQQGEGFDELLLPGFIESGPDTAGESPAEGVVTSTGSLGVIPTGSGNRPGQESNPTLGEILDGEEGGSPVGEQVTGVSPYRSAGVFLLCLALVFAAMWVAGKFRRGVGRISTGKLAVIETIGIGAGRQIMIVEMQSDALVLGVTPHSINLLDKVPMMTLNGSYSGTVNQIISSETESLSSNWEAKPRLESEAVRKLPPPLPNAAYGPGGLPRLSVSEMKKARAQSQWPATGRRGGQPMTSRASDAKDELIGRFRSQMDRLEG